MSNNVLIRIDQICKSFKADSFTNDVLRNVDFSINEHEFVCILGHTGCGKSTLMRIIAGFEMPDSGIVTLERKEHTGPDRDIIMIFQDYNQLYPWKTTLGNIVFALRESDACRNKKEAESIGRRLLKEVGLEKFEAYYPHQLSGGMRQRVAVARALALNPKALIMDEPFSSLDEITRRKLQGLCREIFEQHNTSIIFVTHSVEEAISVSDRILIMNQDGGEIMADLKNVCREMSDNLTRRDFREEILSYLLQEEKRK